MLKVIYFTTNIKIKMLVGLTVKRLSLPNSFPCDGVEYLCKTKKFYLHPHTFYPVNIRLDEDVLKSFVSVFRRQDVFKTNMFALALSLQRMSSRRLGQDQYIPLGHTSSRRFQDIFKTSSGVFMRRYNLIS